MRNLDQISLWPIGDNSVLTAVALTGVGTGLWVSMAIPDEIRSMPPEDRPLAKDLWEVLEAMPNTPTVTLHFSSVESIDSMINQLLQLKANMPSIQIEDLGKPN